MLLDMKSELAHPWLNWLSWYLQWLVIFVHSTLWLTFQGVLGIQGRHKILGLTGDRTLPQGQQQGVALAVLCTVVRCPEGWGPFQHMETRILVLLCHRDWCVRNSVGCSPGEHHSRTHLKCLYFRIRETIIGIVFTCRPTGPSSLVSSPPFTSISYNQTKGWLTSPHQWEENVSECIYARRNWTPACVYATCHAWNPDASLP